MKPLRLTIALVLLTCVYGSARADGITIQVAAPVRGAVAINNESFKIKSFTIPNSSESTLTGIARADVATPGPVFRCAVLKLPGVVCDTGIATTAGPTTVAKARALGETKLSVFPNILVDTKGSFAQVNAGRERGIAISSFRDPFIFDNASGQTLTLSFGLTAGFGLKSFIEGGEGMAFSSISTSAGSNIPGLETFFSWTLALDGQELLFSFSSNLPGLDPTAISNSFLSHLVFNPADGSYLLTSDFDYASFSVTVPAGQERVALTWNSDATAEASGVPEPATIFLLSIGLAGVAAKERSRRNCRKAARSMTTRV